MTARPGESSVRVLVVRRDDGLQRMAAFLRSLGVVVDEATRVDEALRLLSSRAHDLVLSDLPFWAAAHTPGAGHELLSAQKVIGARAPFVAVVEREATNETRDLLILAGATDCISRDVLTEHHVFDLLVRFAGPLATDVFKLVGRSPAIQRVRRLTLRAAQTNLPVLVCGETGTGKELVAQAIHAHGPRRSAQFVTIDCGSLTPTLINAQLFGNERGSFTGADRARAGLFEQAAGGTLFLDEIGELPAQGQASLLRALETGRIRRIGAAAEIAAPAGVVAATNRDLRHEIAGERFRQDLYQRLAGIEILIPPLRERREDIELLVESILRTAPRPARFTDEAVAVLTAYDWSDGNVRELKMFVLRLLALHDDRAFDAALVKAFLGGPARRADLAAMARRVLATELDRPPEDACRDALYGEAIAMAGSHTGAAELLQRDRRAVDRWAEQQRKKGRK